MERNEHDQEINFSFHVGPQSSVWVNCEDGSKPAPKSWRQTDKWRSAHQKDRPGGHYEKGWNRSWYFARARSFAE